MPPQEKMPQASGESECEAPVEMQCTAGFANGAFVPDPEDKSEKPAPEEAGKGAFEFDDLLPQIGEFGIYQKILFLMMIPFAFFVAWVYFTQIFITIVPEQHWCWVPELANLTIEER